MRAFSAILAILLFGGLAASAETSGHTPCDGREEVPCMLDAIWSAAELLPSDKQARVKGDFLRTVSLAGDPALTAAWSRRLGAAEQPFYETVPYARQRAEEALRQGGWDAFLQKARSGAAPFNIGRPEVMAAGARLAPDMATRRKVTDVMFDLAGPAIRREGFDGAFEQADFGHVLAELAMESCDLAMFDRARTLTAAPESLRYALWRARITGNATALAARIRNEVGTADTRIVRGALEGYAPILERGYCR